MKYQRSLSRAISSQRPALLIPKLEAHDMELDYACSIAAPFHHNCRRRDFFFAGRTYLVRAWASPPARSDIESEPAID
jgi:hypothetical protein